MTAALLALIATLSLATGGYAGGAGGKSLVPTTRRGLALQGYDPVAYFTDKYWPHLVVAKAGKTDPIDSLLGRSVLDLSEIP